MGASVVWFREERTRETGDGDVAALVEELDLPGAGQKLEKRQAAIGEILTVMRDSGSVSREEILAIAEQHDYGGYGSGSSFRSNVWANHALPQLKERGVVCATDTSGMYEFGELAKDRKSPD